MNDSSGKSTSLLSVPGILLMLAMAAGVIWYRAPLQPSRSALESVKEAATTISAAVASDEYHEAEVPLWQDPFLAVPKLKSGLTAPVPETTSSDDEGFSIRQPRTIGIGGVRVLFVMEIPGQSPEGIEQRLRARLAVMGGLRAEGFTPVHAGRMFHLVVERGQLTGDRQSPRAFESYQAPVEQFIPPPSKGYDYRSSDKEDARSSAQFGQPDSTVRQVLSRPFTPSGRLHFVHHTKAQDPPAAAPSEREMMQPAFGDSGYQVDDVLILPYEWFSQDVVALRAGYSSSIQHVMVMWLPEGEFHWQNLKILDGLIGGLDRKFRTVSIDPIPPAPPVEDKKSVNRALRHGVLVHHQSTPAPVPTAAPSAGETSYALIGPNASITLRAMYEEANPSLASVMLFLRELEGMIPGTESPKPAPVPPPPPPPDGAGIRDAPGRLPPRSAIHQFASTRTSSIAASISQPPDGSRFRNVATRLRVYAPTPTAEAFLTTNFETSHPIASLGSLDNQVRTRMGVLSFQRLCQTDDVIAQVLVEELQYRGLRIVPSSSNWQIAESARDGQRLDTIALICDHESYFGRAFPQTFNAMLWHNAEQDGKSYRERDSQWRQVHSTRPANVHIYFFPQGIDAPVSKSSSEKSDDSRSRKLASAPQSPELPEGPGQLDYVRRLANSLAAEHRRAGRNRLRAIGIVGADVHDKIVLLQALRAEFPDILFFTTDLDARLLYHENYTFTRNLIVASSYGLTLRDRYQRPSGIASFRDSGQTGKYVACRLALSENRHSSSNAPGINYDYGTILPDQAAQSLQTPLIFEIGREVATTLSPLRQPIDSIHPPTKPSLGAGYWMSVLAGLLLFAALVIYVFPPIRDPASYLFFRTLQHWNLWADQRSLYQEPVVPPSRVELERRYQRGLRVAAFIALATGLPLLALMPIGHYLGGEPFALTSGYSSWPSLAISHAAFVLSMFLLVRAWYQIRRSEGQLESEFLGDSPVQYSARSGRLLPLSVWSFSHREGGRVDVRQLWAQYKSLSARSNRIVRVGTMMFIMTLFWVVVYGLFGEANEPLRGPANLWAGRLVKLSAMGMLAALTLFVVDSTSLSLAFVRNLADKTSLYDHVTLRAFWNAYFTENAQLAPGIQIPPQNLDRINDFVDIAIIGQLTKAVFRILIYPFLVLTLLILARSKLFDNFVWSTMLLVVYSMLFAYVLWCAIALQRYAERARREAIVSARRKLDAVRRSDAQQPLDAVTVYESAIRQIESQRGGAFMSFYDNPILRAILLPTGGTTLVAIFEYLSLF